MAKSRQVFTEREKTIILNLYKMGKTDQQVADVVGMPRKTFTDVLIYNGLTASIKKDVADDEIEHTLFEKAKGGDTTSMIFWLKNRRSEQWRDRHEIKNEHEINVKKLSDSELDSLLPEAIDILKNHRKE